MLPQDQMTSYSLIVFINKTRKRYRKFKSEEQLITLGKAIRKEFPEAEIHIINHLHPSPPSKERVKTSGTTWCPFCGEYRKFKTWYNIRRCEVCYVSNNEFYVRKYNNMWHHERQNRKTKGKAKGGKR